MDQLQVKYIDRVFPKLVSISGNRESLEALTEEDIRTGFEIFHAIIYCPSMNINLFQFVDKVLSSDNTRTIIQAIVNLFHSKILKDRESIGFLKEFYGVVAETLHLQYGNILLATSTKSQLQAVIDNDWPFFGNNTELVQSCLMDSKCGGVKDIIESLGKYFKTKLSIEFNKGSIEV